MARRARHADGGGGFGATVVRQGVGAALVVAVAAGMFLALGTFGGGFDGLGLGSSAPEAPVEAAPDPAPVPPVEEPSTEEEVPVEEPVEEEPQADRIDPATVSVQVLDGYKQDGGTLATALAEELRTLGYPIVAVNSGRDYEVSVVFWGRPEDEAKARQVAADLGITEVRPNPGTLRDDVPVHVMVGADRAA